MMTDGWISIGMTEECGCVTSPQPSELDPSVTAWRINKACTKHEPLAAYPYRYSRTEDK